VRRLPAGRLAASRLTVRPGGRDRRGAGRAVALVGLTTAGCGGGGGGSDGGAAHYANTTYRFSLDVDRRLTQWRTASAATGAAFEVSFVDTKARASAAGISTR